MFGNKEKRYKANLPAKWKWFTAVLTSIGYWYCLDFGHYFFYAPKQIWLFWPAEAFLIGVVTLTSQYFRKESLILIFITKLIFGYFKQDFPWIVNVAIAFADVILVTLAIDSLHFFRKSPVEIQKRPGDFLFFIIFALGFSNVVNAIIGATAVVYGFGGNVYDIFQTWFLSSTLGCVVLSPLIISLPNAFSFYKKNPMRIIEIILIVILGAIWSNHIFGIREEASSFLELPFSLYPLLILVAWRYGVFGSSLNLFIITTVAMIKSIEGGGPFAAHGSGQAIEAISLQTFIYVTVLSFLMLAVLIEALVENNAVLESKVLKRTDELNSALEKAKAADSAKSKFLAMMSHEIRTPMNGVIGCANLLKNKNLDQDESKLVEAILSSGNMLLTILNDILDFSKIEAGKLEIEHVAFEPARALKNVFELFIPRAKEKNIDYQFITDIENNLYLVGDVNRLKQVLGNLISNAIKFTEKGSIEIYSCLFQESDENYTLQIQVKDTGIGMSEETITKLFMPFVQEDASIARVYGGTGLGLSISLRIVELMGGKLKVDSKVREGSLFTLTLPLLQSKSLTDEKEKIIFQENKNNRVLKILIAEDNPINQMVIERMLSNRGHKCRIAEDGLKAVSMFQEEKFDLIFMDIQMPKLSGIDAAKQIRQFEATHNMPRIKIIALTANAMDSEKMECFEAGIDLFISKPITPEKLAKTFLL